MKEFKLDKQTFMGGWYIDTKLCDKIIKIYKQIPTVLKGGGETSKPDGSKEINKDIKDSSDISIESNNFKYPLNKYHEQLQACLENYVKKYPDVNQLTRFVLTPRYNIQHYKKGGGFKMWHCERGDIATCKRCLVFMTYLNDVPDGGTMFKNQDLTIPAKTGLTLIWPAEWTHTHKGQISNTKEKYIVTGWYHLIV